MDTAAKDESLFIHSEIHNVPDVSPGDISEKLGNDWDQREEGSIIGLLNASAQQITALIALSDSTYVVTQWQTALLSWAILGVAILANTVLFRKLPLIEGIVTFLHVLGFFAFVIVLWCVFETHRPQNYLVIVQER
ncbi:uncharacterized protein KY384_008971 [Bacidia gigantensis]|uniref:uncharacterized protein n=1 Tax=Bacidia gigantensis TaxID=2732470 RepID=UPI001D04C052|nr:uncharacterized protein KY384_008971 [Bacidia gigantensis]KAG8525327.1 hypothetical protein KY384_008971 [Bacidia gigantensis]